MSHVTNALCFSPHRWSSPCKRRRNTWTCHVGSTTFSIIQASDSICLMSSSSRTGYTLTLTRENVHVLAEGWLGVQSLRCPKPVPCNCWFVTFCMWTKLLMHQVTQLCWVAVVGSRSWPRYKAVSSIGLNAAMVERWKLSFNSLVFKNQKFFPLNIQVWFHGLCRKVLIFLQLLLHLLFIDFVHVSRFLSTLFSMDVYTSFVKVESYIVCQGSEKGNMQMLQSIYVME